MINSNVASWCVFAVSLAGSSLPAMAGVPTITSFSPASGAPGTVITVNGSGFTGLNSAWLVGTAPELPILVVSDTQAQITVPPGAISGRVGLLAPPNAAWTVAPFHVKTSGGGGGGGGGIVSWAYKNGVFSWPGDWSGDAVTLNYQDTVGDPGIEDVSVHVNSSWGYWLPYCPQDGPTIHGYTVPSCDVSTYAAITMQLKATIPNQTWSLAIFKYTIVNGELVDDTIVGGVGDLTPYGGPALVGKFVTYTIPLSELGASGLTTMYKFLLQDQTGRSGQTWYINQVGFTQ